jgi:oligoendopeptidase F
MTSPAGSEDTLPRWDLGDLFASPDDLRIAETIDSVKADTEAFAARYRGGLAGLDPAGLAGAIAEYERLRQESAKPAAFAALRFAADTAPANGAFYQKIREQTTAATLPLLFFEVEMSALPLEQIDALIEAPVLASYRHFLQEVRAAAPFRLSEPEERILEEKANTGWRAFTRLFDEITSSLRFTAPGREKPLTLSEVSDLMQHPDGGTRKAASVALTAGLVPNARTLAYIYNTLAQDKATEDRLRGYAYPEEARHVANELSPEIVETVMGTAERGFPLVARYYAAKRQILGLPELFQYDRYAPLLPEDERFPFDLARAIILEAFAGFHADYASAAATFFDKGWIDAAPRPGKRGGAFCSYITPDKHPYIFQSYLGKRGDVRTLAHEFGHGVHSYVSRDQTYLNFHGTLPMAEVASTFAEQLVFDKQVAGADERARFAAYGHQIEQAFATIFRQTVLYRFEQAVHRERREKGELTVARFGEIWQEKSNAMFSGAVTFDDGHALWWSYIPHFISTPFYVYAYTFGLMLALALYQRYRQEGRTFAPKYLAMLRAGGSLPPAELVAPLGVDLTDAAFWQGAITIVEEQVSAFEALAGRISPPKVTGS